MSNPRLEVFKFEYFLNTAIVAQLLIGGINDPKKQGADSGVVTPLVTVKSRFRGWGPNNSAAHMWISATGDKYPDCRDAIVELKCITKRNDKNQSHDDLVGTVRGLMLTSRVVISGRMEWHALNHIQESPSEPAVEQTTNFDATTLSFDIRMSILYATKTSEIFIG